MITRRFVLGTLLGLASTGFTTSKADASLLQVPGEKVILTISGKVSQTNQSGAAVFDLPMLEALEQASIRTVTPWFNGPVTFEGVPMARLMDAVGAQGKTLVVSALNDYTSEIPIEDFDKYHPILAMKRDGNYMPVRDKGPLFIVYPYDSSPELNKQKFYSRSPWQIARMQVV